MGGVKSVGWFRVQGFLAVLGRGGGGGLFGSGFRVQGSGQKLQKGFEASRVSCQRALEGLGGGGGL